MNRAIINIGLENNKRNTPLILQYLRKKVFTFSKYNIKVGEYNGESERTLVIQGKLKINDKEFIEVIDYLNEYCTQECISYKLNNVGTLQYNKDFQGERYTFDNQFFITL